MTLMINKLIPVFALVSFFASSCLVNKTDVGVVGYEDSPHDYMTEASFNADFSLYMTSPGVTFLQDEKITYFYNLYNYSPQNSYGSCGYVSFIQYLSYYDCFYNDSIIPESFEKNQGEATSLNQARAISPGVLRQSYPEEPNALYNFIQNNMDTDYQMYLMHIVNEAMGNTANQYSYSIGMWNYYRIVNTISAFNNTTFTYTRVQDFGSGAKPTDTNVIYYFDSFVKAQLDLGNPVMLHIASYDSTTNSYNNYHSVVAYYYDDYGIHANFGWGPGSTDTIISNYYQITEAGVIDFSNVLEVHSDNFRVNQGTYCGCGYHTNHGYCDHYSYYSPQLHTAYCECGTYTLRPHAVQAGSIFTMHGHSYADCIDCGALIDIGATIGVIVIQDLQELMVTENGSYILPNGIYIIVNSDIDSYLCGTLEFHRRDTQIS